jgi:hypothetical protein
LGKWLGFFCFCIEEGTGNTDLKLNTLFGCLVVKRLGDFVSIMAKTFLIVMLEIIEESWLFVHGCHPSTFIRKSDSLSLSIQASLTGPKSTLPPP